jgi:hypothetical protein
MKLRIARDGRPFDRQLVRAARNESPAWGAEERALAALGLSATAMGAVKSRVPSGGALGAGGSALVVASLAVGIGVAAWAIRSQANARTTIPTLAESAPQIETPALAPAFAPRVTILPAPSSSVVRAATAPAKTTHVAPLPLSGEIALVQQAARALASGEPSMALRVLDTYGSQYPGGALAEEASVLRAQALARTGEATQARALAERLIAADPQGVFARRLRDVIDQVAHPSVREQSGGP